MKKASSVFIDPNPLNQSKHLVHIAKVCAIVNGCALVATVIGTIGIVATSNKLPPLVIESVDNRLHAGEFTKLEENENRMNGFIRDVVEATLSRNQKGLVPQLKDYCTTEAFLKLEQESKVNKPKGEFIQEFKIDETDGLRFASINAFETRLLLRGTLESRNISRVARSRIYWAAQFIKGPRTPTNSLGWRLNDLFPISETAFYAEDRAKAASEAVSVPTKKANTPK